MFLTAELVFTIFMLAAEKHKGTFIAPIGIGLALFIAELSGVFFAVLLSTVLQGTTVEPLARRLRLTTSEPALPRPLTEADIPGSGRS